MKREESNNHVQRRTIDFMHDKETLDRSCSLTAIPSAEMLPVMFRVVDDRVFRTLYPRCPAIIVWETFFHGGQVLWGAMGPRSWQSNRLLVTTARERSCQRLVV